MGLLGLVMCLHLLRSPFHPMGIGRKRVSPLAKVPLSPVVA